nr:MAG TPA: tail protein [Caudoviricetes sp.]
MVVEAEETLVLKTGVAVSSVNPDLNFRLRLDIGGANIRIADNLKEDKETGRFWVDRESGLDMDFDIVKTDDGAPNESTITIWNLSENTYTNIMNNADAFELYAAWSNDEYALMFRGYPLKALKKAKGTILTSNQGFLKQDANAGRRGQNDLETVITLIDGLAEYKDARMDKTYYGTVSTETILKDCVETFGIPVGTIAEINHKDIMGRQYREKSVNVLNGLARLLGFKWKIINGMFYIFTQEEPEEVYGITLNSDNSSTPERQNDKFTTKKNKETKQTSIEKTYNGYMIKTRLLPFLNPGTWAFCDFGTRLQGTKYIYKVRHRGNNYGTVAETEIYCV